MYYMEVDWSHLAGHADNRSERHPGDTDIPVEWAQEACDDPDAALIDPDYNSKSGLSARVVGYSETGKLLVTTIIVKFEGKLYAASAWPANQKDQRLYKETDE